jgi:ABC-type transport system substrate-binding protein
MRKVNSLIGILLALVIVSTSFVGFAELPNQPYGPLYDERRYVKIADPSAALAAFKAGDLDFLSVSTKADLQAVQQMTGIKLYQKGVWSIWSYYFGINHTIVNDINFRRAIAHLTDKEDIIDTLFGPLAASEHNFINPYMRWYDPNVPDVTEFDPALAASMLDQAGYTMGSNGVRIDPATGTTMRELDVLTQSEWDATWNIFIQRFVEQLHQIGIPARLEDIPFAGGAQNNRIYVLHDFDILWSGWSSGLEGNLEANYASYGWLNYDGYNSSALDALFLKYSGTLNQTEAQQTFYQIQEFLVQNLPAIPIVCPISITAVKNTLVGWVNTPYYGTNTMLRMRFKSGIGGTITSRVTSEPNSYIVGTDTTAWAWYLISYSNDQLIDTNPLTGDYVPNVATAWKVESWSDPAFNVTTGTKITIWIRNDIYWQDGVKFTTADMEFTQKYAADFGSDLWRVTMAPDLVNVKAVNDTQIEYYFGRASFGYLGWFNDWGPIAYPKHLYNPNATRYGTPEGPMGLQTPGKPGVPDPAKFAAAFVPYPNPPADKPWLTCMIGIGPLILKSYEWGVGATFVANRNYFYKVLVTDVNFDRKVNILDISQTAKAFGSSVGQPRFNPTSDINGDDTINILDIAAIAKDWNKSY